MQHGLFRRGIGMPQIRRIRAQRIVRAVIAGPPAAALDDRTLRNIVLGAEITGSAVGFVGRAIGIHILYMADTALRAAAGGVVVAGNIIAAVHAQIVADDAAHGAAIAAHLAGEAVVLHCIAAPGLRHIGVRAQDAAHHVRAAHAAGNRAAVDRNLAAVRRGGIGIAAADDAAGLFAAGDHAAGERAIGHPAFAHRVIARAQNAADIILAVYGGGAGAVRDRAVYAPRDGADHGFALIIADHNAAFHGAVANGDIERRGAARETVRGNVCADQTGLQRGGAGLQRDIVDADGFAGKTHALQIVYKAVARDPLAVDIQIGNLRALHVAQQRKSALGHGQGLAVAVQIAAEGQQVLAVPNIVLSVLRNADGLPSLGQGDVRRHAEILALRVFAGSDVIVQRQQILRRRQLIGRFRRALAAPLVGNNLHLRRAGERLQLGAIAHRGGYDAVIVFAALLRRARRAVRGQAVLAYGSLHRRAAAGAVRIAGVPGKAHLAIALGRRGYGDAQRVFRRRMLRKHAVLRLFGDGRHIVAAVVVYDFIAAVRGLACAGHGVPFIHAAAIVNRSDLNVGERIIFYRGDARVNYDALQRTAVGKHGPHDHGNARGNFQRLQRRAAAEDAIPQIGNAVRNINALQRGAFKERGLADRGQAFRQRHGCELIVAPKGAPPNALYGSRNLDAGNLPAVPECGFADHDRAVRDNDVARNALFAQDDRLAVRRIDDAVPLHKAIVVVDGKIGHAVTDLIRVQRFQRAGQRDLLRRTAQLNDFGYALGNFNFLQRSAPAEHGYGDRLQRIPVEGHILQRGTSCEKAAAQFSIDRSAFQRCAFSERPLVQRFQRFGQNHALQRRARKGFVAQMGQTFRKRRFGELAAVAKGAHADGF